MRDARERCYFEYRIRRAAAARRVTYRMPLHGKLSVCLPHREAWNACQDIFRWKAFFLRSITQRTFLISSCVQLGRSSCEIKTAEL